MMIPLAGFTPDRDPTQPGVITECVNLVPFEKGMQGGPANIPPVGIGPLPAQCRGSTVITLLDGSRRLLAGTPTKLYELAGTTWNDVTRAVGGDYTTGLDGRWIFAQFGNATIATNDADVLQASVTSGAFANITGAPSARTVVAAGNFVLAFNTSDATYGDSPDRWRCCAFQNHTDWAVAVSTQANTGRLIAAPGEITCAAVLGGQVVVCKRRAMFVGNYVGTPIVWDFTHLPGEIGGCVGPEAICDIGDALIGVGEDGIWMFDGTRPYAIDADVRQWFLARLSQTNRFRTQVAYDRALRRVWIFFPSSTSADGSCDSALVFNLLTKQWGRADRAVEAVLNYVSPGLTWDSIGAVYTTWDSLPGIPYDSQFWLAGGRVFSIFDASHQVQNLVGSSISSGFTTGDIGDDDACTLLKRARLRFLQEPAAGSVAGSERDGSGVGFRVASNGTLHDSGFDVMQKARWHRLQFTFTGPVALNASSYDLKRAGTQ